MTKTNTAPPAMPFGNFFPDLTDFFYAPLTNWQGMFQNFFSPRIVFGANINDQPVEQHVLNKVGSYGKQINCLFDAVEVLVSRVDRQKLSEPELYALLKLEDMARQADQAAAEFQGKPSLEAKRITEPTAGEWIDMLQKLREENPTVFSQVSRFIKQPASIADPGSMVRGAPDKH